MRPVQCSPKPETAGRRTARLPPGEADRRSRTGGRPAQVTPSSIRSTPTVPVPAPCPAPGAFVVVAGRPGVSARQSPDSSVIRRLISDRSGRRPMARPDKAAAVAELVESFQESAGAVLTEYRGLTVKQLQDLRRALGENANYAVVKNTLTQIAATRRASKASTTCSPVRPPSPSSTATWSRRPRVCVTLPRQTPPSSSRAATSTASPLDAAEIAKLADLESREVLLAKLAGGDARVAQPGRLPAQRPAGAGCPPRRRPAGQGRAGPVDPPGWCRCAGRRRGAPRRRGRRGDRGGADAEAAEAAAETPRPETTEA